MLLARLAEPAVVLKRVLETLLAGRVLRKLEIVALGTGVHGSPFDFQGTEWKSVSLKIPVRSERPTARRGQRSLGKTKALNSGTTLSSTLPLYAIPQLIVKPARKDFYVV